MQEWLKTQLARGFPAFAGSTVSGTIAVTQELVNELIAEGLHATRKDLPDAASPLDLGALAKSVKTAAVRAETGKLSIDFSIEV